MKVYILIDEVEEAQLLIEDGVLKEIDIDEAVELWMRKEGYIVDGWTNKQKFSQYLEDLKC